jgi:hypothetical protein
MSGRVLQAEVEKYRESPSPCMLLSPKTRFKAIVTRAVPNKTLDILTYII